MAAGEDGVATCLRRLTAIAEASCGAAAAWTPPQAAAAAAAAATGPPGASSLLTWPAVRAQLLAETRATLDEVAAWAAAARARVDAVGGGGGAAGPTRLVSAMARPRGALLPLTCGHNASWRRPERHLVEVAVRHMLLEWARVDGRGEPNSDGLG